MPFLLVWQAGVQGFPAPPVLGTFSKVRDDSFPLSTSDHFVVG